MVFFLRYSISSSMPSPVFYRHQFPLSTIETSDSTPSKILKLGLLSNVARLTVASKVNTKPSGGAVSDFTHSSLQVWTSNQRGQSSPPSPSSAPGLRPQARQRSPLTTTFIPVAYSLAPRLAKLHFCSPFGAP